MSVLVVEGVEKWWDATSGLRRLSLRIDAGELVVVRGRSGSGKSTLLALVAGWCSPDTGTITVDGDAGVAGLPWSAVAIVPQVLGLVPELTVRENVADGASLPTAVEAALDALDLVSFAGRPPAETSMGQQQRAAIARAVAASPLVLLADEPTSHQDAGHVASVVAVLRAVADAGTAVLVATHDESVVAAATRVIDLEVGRDEGPAVAD